MTVDPTLAALGCALFYGTSTYLGGRAAVHIGPTRAVGIFQITGFLLALALCAIAGASGSLSPPSVKDGLLALVSGLCFAIGWIFLAKGLARGRTTIVAPIESLTSVGLCAAVEGLLIGWPGQELGVGIALAAGAAALIGMGSPEQVRSLEPARYSVAMGVAAGALFGVSYLALGFVSAGAGVVALVTMRFFAAAGSLGWLAFASHAQPDEAIGSQRQGAALATAGGVCDGLGTFCFILATVNALVGVSVAILSLYAAVTVLLGIILLKERPSQAQLAGLTTAVCAILLLTR
jgi:drug/metabolite transporter (DMT)-like permease